MPVLAAGSALAWSALPFAAVRILVHQGHSRRELNDLKEREKVERTKHSSPFNTLKKTAEASYSYFDYIPSSSLAKDMLEPDL